MIKAHLLLQFGSASECKCGCFSLTSRVYDLSLATFFVSVELSSLFFKHYFVKFRFEKIELKRKTKKQRERERKKKLRQFLGKRKRKDLGPAVQWVTGFQRGRDYFIQQPPVPPASRLNFHFPNVSPLIYVFALLVILFSFLVAF